MGQRERNGNGEARRAGDRVVGPTKLPGSTTDTFLGSNHQDTMTTRSLASSPTRRPSAVGLVTALLLIAAALFIDNINKSIILLAAFFYAGSSKSPGNNGFRVRDERGTTNLLKRYRKKDITLTLPDGKTLNNIKWFSVWCDEFSVNFGDVKIPRGFDYPKPQKLKTLSGIHGVSSEPVVVVDAQTLLIPNAKFWVGTGPTPSSQGIRVPDENGKEQPLRRYDRKTIVLTLPGDLTVHQLGHFGVWCEAFAVDFGHVQLPHSLNVPPSLRMLGVSPQNVHRGGQGQLGALTSAYEISSFASSSPSPFTISFASSLSQQHQRPTTYRPLLRRGDQFVHGIQAVEPLISGQAEEFRQAQSPAYAGYQEQFYRTADAAASPTSSPYRPQPSARSRLVEPQQNSYARLLHFQGDRRIDSFSKLNCEVLEDTLAFEVRWAVAGDSIVVQLVAKLDAGQYMSFGLSADTERSVMVGGDPTVAWVDKQTLQGYAIDYFLDAKSQCSGQHGLGAAVERCDGERLQYRHVPETAEGQRRIGPAYTDEQIAGYNLGHRAAERASGGQFSQPLSEDRSVHRVRQTARVELPDAGSRIVTRRPQRVPATPAPASTNDAWEIPPIQCYEPDDGVFYAQMGPTGGKHGYPAITGHVGWGISWYINGLLIPVINVVRGRRYSFVTEGGLDPDIPARYHPFYITDDPIGGYYHKTAEEKAKVKIFAGVRRQRGKVIPTGVGRLCNWVPDENQPPADDFASFGAYQRTLTLECDVGEPGIVEWTPDENTPDTVYYQCFTHRYLGWKINVLDSCDTSEPSPAASEKREMYAEPEQDRQDLEYDASIAVPSKRPSLSHGTRLPYVTAAISNTQLPFSRAPHHYASNYHHYVHHQLPLPPPRYYHQPEPPRTQLMIIRRPAPITRHPSMLQTLQQAAKTITGALSLPFSFAFPSTSPRPFLIERKKSVYRPPVAITTLTMLKTTPNTMTDKLPPFEKLAAKIDTKQRTKLEAKVGSRSDITDNHMGSSSSSSWKFLKPARNTGFNPDSIVIESGFKPIIKNNVDRASDVAQKRLSTGSSWQDETLRKNGDYRTIDEFSPVFVPSLPLTIDGSRKRKKKTSPARSPPRLDDLDDMEMAADLRLDTYYLPPIGRTRPEQLPSTSSSGVLITYDGKKLRDFSGLARSISDVEHRGKGGRLTSDILSRTPQFGKFQGELPPLIPGETRANGSVPPPSYEKQNRLSVVELPPKTSTRLTLVERSKRSPRDVGRTMPSADFQRGGDRGRRERDRVKSVSGGARLSSLGWVVLIAIAARLAI
ncbi:Uncharacterized protein DBV15_04339 [Temnothorax longispinosus]|uniref:DM13 domain-containing protein n=1 Tax=Temnothorax longispinosus TaxID=300112 RepID=A0A4V6RGC7_9HYME|nr:Uncharacterized protein DBV15_04339 [Temnothorax longispinosus]